MKKYIYLLWSHDEHGPVGLKATSVRDDLIVVAESMDVDGWFERVGVDIIAKLKTYLSKRDEDLSAGDGIHNLMDGWGGLYLQVVELYQGV